MEQAIEHFDAAEQRYLEISETVKEIMMMKQFLLNRLITIKAEDNQNTSLFDNVNDEYLDCVSDMDDLSKERERLVKVMRLSLKLIKLYRKKENSLR